MINYPGKKNLGIQKKNKKIKIYKWKDILKTNTSKIEFENLTSSMNLQFLYSSGTTGKPKCICHRAGGVLLQHLKEHQLHCDIKPGDKVFYFTTCGWMMWNWLIVLYHPMHLYYYLMAFQCIKEKTYYSKLQMRKKLHYLGSVQIY